MTGITKNQAMTIAAKFIEIKHAGDKFYVASVDTETGECDSTALATYWVAENIMTVNQYALCCQLMGLEFIWGSGTLSDRLDVSIEYKAKLLLEKSDVTWKLCSQVLCRLQYWYAICLRNKNAFHVTASMNSPEGVQMYIERLYPGAKKVN